MKRIVLLLLLVLELVASTIKAPILTIDEKNQEATIAIDKIDVGMSGFIVHTLDKDHASILNNVVVSAYDKESKIATLKMSSYDGLRNNALPTGEWKSEVGDTAILAFGYTRALLIAPSEEIYHRISKSVNIQWIHPDIFATVLSFCGHPTPLKEDFAAMSSATSVGLTFLYINQKVFTLDAKSFMILSVSDAPLEQKETSLPFYSRVQEIGANWWGEGSNDLEAYEPHYYELLVASNAKNKTLYNVIKNQDEKYHYLLKDFEIKD